MLQNATHPLNLDWVMVVTSKVTDCRSPMTNKYNEEVWNLAEITRTWHRDAGVSKCCWKNGTDKLSQSRLATNLQFVKKHVICEAQYKEVCLLFMVHLSTTPNQLNSPSSWFLRKSQEYSYLGGRGNSCSLKLTENLLHNHLLIYLNMPCPPLALPLSSHRHPD